MCGPRRGLRLLGVRVRPRLTAALGGRARPWVLVPWRWGRRRMLVRVRPRTVRWVLGAATAATKGVPLRAASTTTPNVAEAGCLRSTAAAAGERRRRPLPNGTRPWRRAPARGPKPRQGGQRAPAGQNAGPTRTGRAPSPTWRRRGTPFRKKCCEWRRSRASRDTSTRPTALGVEAVLSGAGSAGPTRRGPAAPYFLGRAGPQPSRDAKTSWRASSEEGPPARWGFSGPGSFAKARGSGAAQGRQAQGR